jgi:hypothetical protein
MMYVLDPNRSKKDDDSNMAASNMNVANPIDSATKTDFDFQSPNILPLSERILPDAWLNIPACLVKAFHTDIEN